MNLKEHDGVDEGMIRVESVVFVTLIHKKQPTLNFRKTIVIVMMNDKSYHSLHEDSPTEPSSSSESLGSVTVSECSR